MRKLLFIFSLLVFSFYILYSCKKEESTKSPIVETASVDNISNTSARIGGRVTDDGGVNITERGIYWDTAATPEVNGTKIQVGSGPGDFYDTLMGLTSGTKYYVKAYAKNSIGISYGALTFFTTQIDFPTIVTSPITETTETTAIVGGNVTDDGGFAVTERGIYCGRHSNPVLTGEKVILGKGKGNFSDTLTGLTRSVMYYVVTFATNIKGTSYGSELSFTTNPSAPFVNTIVACDVNTSSAKIGGDVVSNGGSEVTERGIYWGTSPSPQTSGTKVIIGKGNGTFSTILENLEAGSEYYFCAYAVNLKGTTFGSEATFTTLGEAPTALTLSATNVKATRATIGGLISSNYVSTSVRFEYGTTTSYGNTEYIADPVTGSADTVLFTITGLQSNTTYHYRVVATNNLGSAYASDSTFRTDLTGMRDTIFDIEDNEYHTIGIGYQTWMIENLRTGTYNNGVPIPQIKQDTSWIKLTNPGYCWYNNDSSSYAKTYGALYNWYVVTSSNNICPSGWHVPTKEDFDMLLRYIEQRASAGDLKEDGTTYWNTPNTGATDSCDFSALGGGKRLDNGDFDYMKVEGNFWTSSDYSTLTASYLQLLYNYDLAFQAYIYKKYGLSVRCIKN